MIFGALQLLSTIRDENLNLDKMTWEDFSRLDTFQRARVERELGPFRLQEMYKRYYYKRTVDENG